MPLAFIALGSNLGDSRANLREAVERLAVVGEVVSESSAYETEPMYKLNQPKFYNSAVSLQTSLDPLSLFKGVKDIEQKMGRTEGERNDARVIDLDVIAYGSLAIEYWVKNDRVLKIPHERVAERRFVLAPLAEIAPNVILPGVGKVEDLLSRTDSDAENVRKVKEDAALSI